jgi:excisionase family DNA binding protein
MIAHALLTEAEAAEALGISPLTLRKWRCTGEQSIRYYKIGRKARYKPEDILEFIERAVRTSGVEAA